jgi:hypothetical protein
MNLHQGSNMLSSVCVRLLAIKSMYLPHYEYELVYRRLVFLSYVLLCDWLIDLLATIHFLVVASS